MSFSQLAGNARAGELLTRGLRTDRLPHSLLFAGPEGVGKRQFAIAVAQAHNCPVRPREGCGDCPTCHRIVAGEHPDVQVVAPDGAFIKVGQVRDVLRTLSYQPFEGRRRLVIFDGADTMNISAANALLKVLEEPPPHAGMILITSSPGGLLETIRSRCQLIRFAPLGIEEMETFLAANYKRPIEDNRLLARLSQGCPGRVHGIDLGEFRTRRKEVLEFVELLGRGKPVTRLLKAAGHFGKKERVEFEAMLDLAASILHDAACLLAGTDEPLLTHADVRPKLADIAERFTFQRIDELLERLEGLRRDLSRNVNRTLALEAVILAFTG
jgi:DNA polymerase III subunit delta'